MELLLEQFLGLAGVAAFIAALINAGKYAGIVSDGSAPKISLVLSLFGFVGMVMAGLFAPDVDISAVNVWAQKAADVILYILGLFSMLGLPSLAHSALKSAGVPVLGFSHSKSKG